MKLAVTGASGFIGSHVVDHLLSAGHQVTVIDRCPPHRGDVGYRDVDIVDLDALVDATKGIDVVFHLAAVSDVNEAAVDPVRTWDLNVTATARVWEAARHNDVRRTILASTVWVYGGAVGDAPLHEGSAFAIEDLGHVYTSSKVAAEMVAHACHSMYGQEYTILRYGIPYGPRMRPALVVPRFVEAALNGEKLTVHGDGSQYRNYVFVEDLAAAHVLALADSGANATFNLEGRDQVSIRRLIDEISAVVGPVEVEYGDARGGDYEGRAVSAAKAATELGWQATTPFDIGLRRYIDWHVAERERRATQATTRASAARSAPATAPVGEATVRRPARILSGAAASLVLLPLLLGPAARTVVGDAPLVAAVLAAAAVAWSVGQYRHRLPRAPLGAATVAAAVWLLSQTSSLAVVALIAVALGAGVGLLLPDAGPIPWVAPVVAGGALVGLAVGGLLHVLAVGAVSLAAVAAVAAVAGVPRVARRPRLTRPSLAFGAATTVFTVALGSWVGATSASASWFGSIVSHGSRDTSRVALTFDTPVDGGGVPDIAAVLERYGVKATFFTNGVVNGDPIATRALVAHGNDVGAMVDERGGVDLLRPSYPPAVRSQRAVRAGVGVCPVFLRPRDGRHTPLMVRAVHRRGMQVVGWEVSPGHHRSRDSLGLALAVLDDVRPGSIVDLPGSPDVVAKALPLIIDGLRARGLEPVSLDQLLHVAPYTEAC